MYPVHRQLRLLTNEEQPGSVGSGMTTLYTIGYGGRGVTALLRVLDDNGITMLIDVRASPNSQIPGYQKDALRQSCQTKRLTKHLSLIHI